MVSCLMLKLRESERVRARENGECLAVTNVLITNIPNTTLCQHFLDSPSASLASGGLSALSNTVTLQLTPVCPSPSFLPQPKHR